MGQINIRVPNDLHKAFSARCKTTHTVMNGLLLDFMREYVAETISYVENRLVPYGHVPGKDANAGRVIPPKEEIPYQLPPPANGTDMTAKQYLQILSVCRMNDLHPAIDPEDKELLLAEGERMGCSRRSVEALLLEYPPEKGSPFRKKTDRFAGVEGA